MQPPGVALDVGRGPLKLSGTADLLLSHGHLDHAVGLPFVLSHRSMQQAADPTRVYCPAPISGRLKTFVEAASALEERTYRWEIVPLRPGDRVELRRDFMVEAFATQHPVPSLGYHLFRRKSRLLPALRDLEQDEIARRSRAGEEVTESTEELVLSYCGDTSAGAFDSEERLYETPLLMVELTYLSPELRDRGEQYGHLHLEDLVDRRERFRNQAILLHHLSRRYRPNDLRQAVDAKLPADLAERVHVWGTLPQGACL